MSKRLGISPKNVESGVLAQPELQRRLWDAVPMRPSENLKSWFPRAASKLGWTARRVRALWNGEARRIDYAEIFTLDQRIAALKAAEARHRKEADEIRHDLALGSARLAVDRGAVQQRGNEIAEPRTVVPRTPE